MAVSLQKSWKWTIKMFLVIHNILPKLSFVLNLLSHSFKMTTICCFMTFLFLFPWVSWHKCWHTIYMDICSEFIHWALWRTLMKTEYFLSVHHTTSILAKPSTWCFEYSADISCSLLINPSQTDESWEGQNTCLYICKVFKVFKKALKNVFEQTEI